MRLVEALRRAHTDLGGGGGSVAEGFTCAVDSQYRSACEELPFYGEHEGKRYCVLHFPGEEKKSDLEEALKSKVAQKDYDFGGAVFPEGAAIVGGYEFDANVNFAGATFLGADFTGAQFNGERTDFQQAQ